MPLPVFHSQPPGSFLSNTDFRNTLIGMNTVMSVDSSAAFARNVVRLLELTAMTRTELARLCDLPLPRISELLAGKYGQNLKTVDLVCDAFNRHFGAELVRPESLISEDFEVPAKIFSRIR